jgi:hypothetical protein
MSRVRDSTQATSGRPQLIEQKSEAHLLARYPGTYKQQRPVVGTEGHAVTA